MRVHDFPITRAELRRLLGGPVGALNVSVRFSRERWVLNSISSPAIHFGGHNFQYETGARKVKTFARLDSVLVEFGGLVWGTIQITAVMSMANGDQAKPAQR